MNNADNKRIFAQCIKAHGVKHQLLKAVEELSELSVELTKFHNVDNTDEILVQMHKARVVDEIADVKVMINQLEMIFPVKDIDNRYQYKITRLHNRLNPPIKLIQGDTNEPDAL